MTKIDVKITNDKITIKMKQDNSVYFEADFCERVHGDEALWSLEGGKFIILFLEKAQEIIWKSAFKGHKEIDTKTVDNTKRLDEFDNDTQVLY